MSPEERLETKQDKLLGKQTRTKTNLELLINLRSSGYDTTKERFTKEPMPLHVISFLYRQQKTTLRRDGSTGQKACFRICGSEAG